jgi:ATP phosphoribosyltransferase
MTEQVRIALPSKGRMEGETLEFLANCGLRVNKTNPRQYSASIPVLPNVLILFQRPRDIPMSVAAGDVDLGITGYDTLSEVEAATDTESIVVIHEALGYGSCSLVLAVPNQWSAVQSVDDLARKAEEHELRVATKYPNALRRFFDNSGVEGIKIVSADGALEAAPSIGYADFIADITSTGTTLKENQMHPLEGGTIVESQAVFIGNREALSNRPELLAITEQMLEFIEAYLRARGQYMIYANMRGETIEEITEAILSQSELGGLQHPTIASLITKPNEGNWWSVSLVVRHSHLYTAIQQIRAIGGSGVVVTPVSYIFDERPQRCQRLLESLQNKERV